MSGQRRVSRRAASTVAVLLVQLVVCLAILVVPLDAGPRHAPVDISAPAVVASPLADRVNARSGRPLDAGVVTSAKAAREDVESGRVVAALSIDLRLNRATLFVSSAQGESLTHAVSAMVRAMAEPYAIVVTTKDVAPLPDGSAGQRGLLLVVAATVLLGLGIAIAVTWHRGPVADQWSHAILRILFAVAVSGSSSLALAALAAGQVGGPATRWWGVLALTMLATTAATLALAGVLGVAGIGVATLVFVVSAAPLARVEHPLLLPAVWNEITPWLPHGACLNAARQVAWYGGAGVARPLLVLLAWIMASCAVLVVARRERRRAGVDLRSRATAP